VGGSSVATTVTVKRDRAGNSGAAAFKSAGGQYAFALFRITGPTLLPPAWLRVFPRTGQAGDRDYSLRAWIGPVSPNSQRERWVEQSNQLFTSRRRSAGVQANVQFAGLVQTYRVLTSSTYLFPTFRPTMQRHSPSRSMARLDAVAVAADWKLGWQGRNRPYQIKRTG